MPVRLGRSRLRAPAQDGGSSADPHAYYNHLVEQSELHFATSGRSAAIVEDGTSDNNENTSYSASEDAIDFFYPGSTNNADQFRTEYLGTFSSFSTASGNILYYWEAKFEDGWAQGDDIDGVISTQKTFQITHTGGSTDRTLEVRTRFSLAPANRVGYIDIRPYNVTVAEGGDQTPEGGNYGSSDTIAGHANHYAVNDDVWTRYWVFVDNDNDELTLWVGDENRTPVRVYDRVSAVMPAGSANGFWFELNTSSTGTRGVDRHIYGRNLVVLRDLANFAAAQALVDQGDQT